MENNMKVKYVETALLLSASLMAHAQLSGVVYDMETRMPVAKANIFVNPKGVVTTDYRGRFFIDKSCSSVTVSHVNYENRVLKRSEVRDTVWLLPKLNAVDDVVIIGHKPKIGFDIRHTVVKSASSVPRQPGGFDFFKWFDRSQKRKTGKERERYQNIMKNY